MGNCLVTKLKDVVDNNELLPFGKVRIAYKEINTSEFIAANVEASEDVVLTIVGDATWTTGQKHITYINEKQIKIEANYPYSYGQKATVNSDGVDFYIDVDKYPITKISFTSNNIKTDIEQISHIQGLKTLYGNPSKSVKGDIKHLKNNTLLESVIFNSNPATENIFGNIEVFANMSNLNTLTLVRNSAIKGDIGSLGNCKKLSVLNLNYIPQITGDVNNIGELSNLSELRIADTKVKGNFNSFLDSLYQAGKRGTLVIDSRNTDVEYEGSVNIKTTSFSVVFDENGWSESI